MKEHAISFPAFGEAELREYSPDHLTLGALEIRGRTLVSLISPGTEISGGYTGSTFPVTRTGYAAVMQVTAVGESVADVKIGDRVFHMGPHQSHFTIARSEAVLVPDGLAAEKAVWARLMSVSMTTLLTTRARPGERVLVTGLGPVGNMAAQIFQSCGYQLVAVDPVEARRLLAQSDGISQTWEHLPLEGPAVIDEFALAIECSGHEQAVLAACRSVRKGGEIVLVGVPWRKRSDIAAFDLLHAVFHRYIHLRSGWEWEIPVHSADFTPGSIFGNLETALRWLAEGRVHVAGHATIISPRQAQEAYQDLLHQRNETLTTIFDWSL